MNNERVDAVARHIAQTMDIDWKRRDAARRHREEQTKKRGRIANMVGRVARLDCLRKNEEEWHHRTLF